MNRPDISTNTHVQIDQFDLCVLTETYHESFCIFGDFYALATQDTEVTKSLFYHKQLKIIVKRGGGGVARASSQHNESFTSFCTKIRRQN